MSLVWHIAFKDMMRLRRSLVVWTALIAAKLGLGVLLIWGVRAEQDMWRFEPFAYASQGLAVLEALMGYVLVAAIVHGDLMVGTTAFWMTRPISGARMFGGKVAALGVIFGAIPIVVTLPWWLACGYGAKEVALAAAETLLWQGVLVLVALPLATLTDGLGRFLLWTLIVVGVIVGLSAQLIDATLPGYQDLRPKLVAAFIFIAGCAAATAFHFCTRRFLVSLVIFTTSAASAFVAVVWPWKFTPQVVRPVDQPGRHAPGIELAFGEALLRKRNESVAYLAELIRVTGVPPELVLRAVSSEHRWNWATGLTLKRDGDWDAMNRSASWLALGLVPPRENPDWAAREANFRWPRGVLPRQSTDANTSTVRLTVPSAFAAGVLRDAPAYSLRAQLQLLRPVVAGERPARDGEIIAAYDEVTRITDARLFYLLNDGNGMYVTSSPRLDPVTRLPRGVAHHLTVTLAEHMPMVFESLSYPFRSRPVYFLINRSRGNVASGSDEEGWRTKSTRIGTVSIAWRTLRFDPPMDSRSAWSRTTEQSNWFDGVTLAKVIWQEEERFTKELRVDRYEITPRTTTGGVR